MISCFVKNGMYQNIIIVIAMNSIFCLRNFQDGISGYMLLRFYSSLFVRLFHTVSFTSYPR